MNKIFFGIFLCVFSLSAHARGSGIDLVHLFLYGGAFLIFLVFLRSIFTVPAKLINLLNGYELSDEHGVKVWLAFIWTAVIPFGITAAITSFQSPNEDENFLLFVVVMISWLLLINLFFRSQRN